MSFFWFNSHVIQCYLDAKFKNPDQTLHDLGDERYKKLYQLNHCFSSSPWGLQHDITDHVKHPFNVVTKTPYTYRSESRNFGDVCLDTAEQISNKTDRPIAVFWSGGIDSTTALVALMQTVDAKNLVVVCNQQSINEFPSFYEQKIKDRVRTISPEELHQHYQDFFSVAGNGGDNVWGMIDESFWHLHKDNIRLPWKDMIDRSKIDDLDFIEEFCSWSGVEIKTWLDLRIWFYLCCKWQDKVMFPYTLRQSLTDKDIVAFYDVNSSFQNWTMNNLDKIIKDRWADYKVPAKEFIYQYHRDIGYFENKSKYDSKYLVPDLITKSTYKFHKRIVVDENFSDPKFPSWPFVDYAEFEDFNDVHELIPAKLLEP